MLSPFLEHPTGAEPQPMKTHPSEESKLSSYCMSRFNTIKVSEKPLNICDLCQKTFVKPSGLKAHIYSHTGEKPHQCSIESCSRRFSLLSNLRRHLKCHDKAKRRPRSPPVKQCNPKILPLLPGDSSYFGGPNDKQPNLLNHDQLNLDNPLPVTPMENNLVGLTLDGNVNNSQSFFSFPSVDWLDPGKDQPAQLDWTQSATLAQQEPNWNIHCDQMWQYQVDPEQLHQVFGYW